MLCSTFLLGGNWSGTLSSAIVRNSESIAATSVEWSVQPSCRFDPSTKANPLFSCANSWRNDDRVWTTKLLLTGPILTIGSSGIRVNFHLPCQTIYWLLQPSCTAKCWNYHGRPRINCVASISTMLHSTSLLNRPPMVSDTTHFSVT